MQLQAKKQTTKNKNNLKTKNNDLNVYRFQLKAN